MDRAEVHRRLTEDFEFFAKHTLTVTTPTPGELLPLCLNKGQLHLNAVAERQLKERGFVRIIGVKGRRQGFSTYVEGRSYWRANRHKGYSILILAHEASSTDYLFAMVKGFHDRTPDCARPIPKVENTREYQFDVVDSKYRIGTAGNASVGRGGGHHFFHLSEAAFCDKADEILGGAGNTVSDAPGTEIFIESTGDGPKGAFYEHCLKAINGESDYEFVFVPWFWEDSYRRDKPPGKTSQELDEEELAYQELYNLDINQMWWRRAKIAASSPTRFMREYPAHAMEAFAASGESLILAEDVMRAFREAEKAGNRPRAKNAPKILGVDPSGGGDEIVFIVRQGMDFMPHRVLRTTDVEDIEMKIAGKIISMIKEDPQIRMVNIDITGGYGRGALARVRELGYGNLINGVNFASKALNDEKYNNRRTEMWMTMNDYIKGVHGPFAIIEPDAQRRTKFQTQLVLVGEPEQTSRGQDKLPKKDRKNSPDIGDSAALTFAYPVADTSPEWIKGGSMKIESRGGLRRSRVRR